MKIAIYKNLYKKKKDGTYDTDAAAKSFKNIVNIIANQWYKDMKKFVDDGSNINAPTAQVKEQAAIELAKNFEQEYANGELDWVVEK
jgi:broad specificity polyphosphatase/5'/3'-nucleotidase SurE